MVLQCHFKHDKNFNASAAIIKGHGHKPTVTAIHGRATQGADIQYTDMCMGGVQKSQWDCEATSIRVLVIETSSTQKHLETVIRVPPTLFSGQAVQKRHRSESWTSKIDRKTPQQWQFTGRGGDKNSPDSWCQRAKETCQNEGDSQIRTHTDQEHKVRIFGQHICSLVWQLKICSVSTSASRCKEKYCVSDFIKSQINDWRSFVFVFF